jgi:cysteine desulfurase
MLGFDVSSSNMFKNLFSLSFIGSRSNKKRIYLDHAAAARVDARVLEAMKPYWSDVYGNASSVHREGMKAKEALDIARARIARILKNRARDVVFTSGGTESNNTVINGVVARYLEEGIVPSDIEIISTKLEHPSVLKVLEAHARTGVRVVYAPVTQDGLIDTHAFSTLLNSHTRLVTFAYAQSELGVVNDVKKLSRIVRLFRQEQKTTYPYIHIDASQAPLWLPLQMDSLGVDLMTLDAGKCHGPKGVGLVASRGDVSFLPSSLGGSQEFGLRAGTENIPLVVGMAEALTIAQDGFEARASAVRGVRDYFFDALLKEFPDTVIHGSRASRIANNVNVSLRGIDGEYAVVWLDTYGVSASTKSACSGNTGGSDAVRLLGGSDEEALGTLRFTLGEVTTKNDIDAVVLILKDFKAKTTFEIKRS